MVTADVFRQSGFISLPRWTASSGSINVRNDQFLPLSITFIIFCESHFGDGYGGGGGEGLSGTLDSHPLPQGNIHPLRTLKTISR